MADNRYVALLRGINVGGRHLVPMADLRTTFEAAGYGSVRTHIQSGNVLFESDAPRIDLEDDLAAMIEARFGFPVPVMIRSRAQLRNVVAKAPVGFGDRPDEFHSDVLFLKGSLTPAKAMKVVQLRDGVDEVWTGTGVLYFARLSERRTESKLGKIAATPEYKQMTIRSWTTTSKLLSLLDAA